jgi:hypothetical protein
MNDYRPPWILAFLQASLRSSLLFIWGGALLWYGMSLGDLPLTRSSPVGHYSFHVMGAIFIVLALCGFAYNMAKLRAPTKAADRPTEAGEIEFDADAAIARYLSNREAEADLTQPPPQGPSVTRPVFGRKST